MRAERAGPRPDWAPGPAALGPWDPVVRPGDAPVSSAVGRLNRACRAEGGQTSVEYIAVLVVVAALIGALVVAGPGIGDSVASAMRSVMCVFDGVACAGPADVAGEPRNPDGEGGGPPGRADAEPQADDDDGGGGWLDRLGPVGDVLDQGGQLVGGFGSQL